MLHVCSLWKRRWIEAKLAVNVWKRWREANEMTQHKYRGTIQIINIKYIYIHKKKKEEAVRLK